MVENLYSYRKAQESLDHLRTAYHNLRTAQCCKNCVYLTNDGCMIHQIRVRENAVCDRFQHAASFDYVKVAMQKGVESVVVRPAIRTATRALVLVSKAIRWLTQASQPVPDGYVRLSDLEDDVVYLESTDHITPLPYWIRVGDDLMLAVGVNGKAVTVKRYYMPNIVTYLEPSNAGDESGNAKA